MDPVIELNKLNGSLYSTVSDSKENLIEVSMIVIQVKIIIMNLEDL